jgi:hypothetical protein
MSKIVLPRNWGFVAEVLAFVPNSVLAGSMVDHVLISDDPANNARVFKDMDIETDQQGYEQLLSKCGLQYEGTPVRSIVSEEIELRLVDFHEHPDVVIYQGHCKGKTIDLFVLSESRASETRNIGGFEIKMQTVESRKQVIDSIVNLATQKRNFNAIWLDNKKKILTKRKEILNKKFNGGAN